ncbi:MAG: outer membrane protein assembly factor [Bacteroidota bacterium]
MHSPHTFFLGLLFILVHLPLNAQVHNRFSGTKRTQLSYLAAHVECLELSSKKEELRCTPLKDQDWETYLEDLRQQLVNLPVLIDAEYTWQVTENQDTLIEWILKEGQTISPLLNFGGIRGNFHYLLGFHDIHFQGRGQTLTAYYQNIDGEHNYSIALSNPSYRGSRWGYRLESRRYAAIEPVFFSIATTNYIYRNLSFEAGAGYRPRPNVQFNLAINAFRERYERQNREENPGVGPQELTLMKFALKAGFRFDQVDYNGEILDGFAWHINTQRITTASDNSVFLFALNDLYFYRQIGSRGNLATRFRLGLSTNENSPFAPFVLDSQVNIRGSGNRIDRGTAQAVLNIEYRHRIWEDRRKRFAAQAVAFSDIGNWRNPGGDLAQLISSENLRHFAGIGLRLISNSSKDAVIRIDYGVDVYNPNERGLVLGFGQYF